MSETGTEAIPDVDRDSLYILPLGIIPIQTPALRRARLIKNVRLHSVLEIFDDIHTGSGQLQIESLPHEFGWPDIPIHPDLVNLRKLSRLSSFDVYSLRVLLRECGIHVNDYNALRLSKRKNEELTSYMTSFTRPLILKIYGDEDVSIQSFEDIVGLFRQPDMKKALEKIRIMANKLEIKIEEIPRFIEDYGDIFLSLSYYRQCLDHIAPIVTEFLEWLNVLQCNWHFRKDQALQRSCRQIQETLNGTMAAITGRFESLDRSTMDLWDNVSASQFRKVEKLIRSYHTTIGGVLCALTVKMETWARTFPNKGFGGPAKRAEFIMSEMRQGIERIQQFESAAPMLAELR